MANSINRIRTIALVGQAGSGKTTLAEALLAKAGAVQGAGSVERGTTVCDYSPLEKQLRHSLKLAVASFDAKVGDEPTRVHLLDTPGYPDFAGHALPALAGVETGAIVINAQNGIEMMTGRFMQYAQKRGLDRLIIVNKIDGMNVDCADLLDRIQQTFGKECLPLNLPASNRTKVSDCFFAPAGEADFSSVEEAHRSLVEHGQRLLNRTTRRLSLTESGRAFYERCVQLLADLEEAEESASALSLPVQLHEVARAGATHQPVALLPVAQGRRRHADHPLDRADAVDRGVCTLHGVHSTSS